MATTDSMNPTTDDFAAMLDESFTGDTALEGTVVKGRIIAVENDLAIIDVGLKTEGRVPLREFHTPGSDAVLATGDEVEVYLERIENAMGEAVLSRDKARREEAWDRLEKSYADNERCDGVIFGRVKGGFTVDLGGAVAFLPGSQVDIRPIRDVGPLMNITQPFQILKMDKRRGNIVVSRRAIMEETRAEQRSELVQNLAEGQVVEGVVKNITDYGAFVDLGGIDGLLHVTDISWKRVNQPSDVLTVGQSVKVQIIKINPETQRISLGMKQLESDPWEGVEGRYPIDARVTGRVTNITDYGAFVELEEGIEGLVHVSEMSWTKKNVHPGKILSTSEEITVQVLEVDPAKRRISLGLKQTQDNPWETFADKFPVGAHVEGEVKNITEFGLFIGLDGEVDGMVHLSDLDWKQSGEEAIKEYKKGEMVKAIVLDVDMDKERISLGVKQLDADPMESATGLRKGATVTCEVTAVQDNGIEVSIAGSDLSAFIRRADLARDRSEQRADRFAVGEKVDARITQIDKANRKISVSIKALEIADEKAAVAQYGSSDSGASLGDILGAALNKAAADAGDDAEDAPAEEAAAEEAPAEEAAAEEAPAEEAAAEEAPAEDAEEDKKDS
ncbi:MAG: 30S ribosomal protein S1 [Rhizobiales bacterium]|nr:30S ribosomal protein S1 [Hyphomicrobiales bacterium]